MMNSDLFFSSDLLSIDRFCRDRFIQFMPAVDVEAGVSLSEHEVLRNKIREVMLCFDRPKHVHIGPALSAALFASGDCLKFLRALFPYFEEVTFFMCANSIAVSKTMPNVPSNVIALQYAHQVRKKQL